LKLAICWFRRDLRLADNPALLAALDAAEAVLPVYTWSPEDEGEWAPGAAARWWLHHSLAALDDALRARGSRLLLRTGPAADTLARLVAESGAEGVFWNRLYDPALVERDAALKTQLRNAGIEARSFKADVLHEPWELATAAGDPYRVFTPFWKAALKRPEPGPPLAPPDDLKAPPRWPSGQALEELGLLPTIRWDAGLAEAWTPGEDGALAQVEAFAADALARYGEGRNRPDRPETSRLSPYLHFGEIGPRQCLAAARAAVAGRPAAQTSADSFIRELGWREFAHHLLHHFPHTPTAPDATRSYEAFPWREEYEAHARSLAARPDRLSPRGCRHAPAVDDRLDAQPRAHDRRLAADQELSHQPWQSGARWFWDTLVDADLANNTMGWQWTAGCGADAAPYFRIFNPIRHRASNSTRTAPMSVTGYPSWQKPRRP
jgi:deoxyribodipyrimidine photo-lyase